MQNRRTFLLSAGAVTAASAVGTVSATRQTDGLTTEVINDAFLSGVAENGSEGAERALEELGLDPVVEETREFESTGRSTAVEGQPATTDDRQITIHNTYEDPKSSDSALVVSASPVMGSDPEVFVSVSMTLSGRDQTVRNS